jgi:hypothetical protein
VSDETVSLVARAGFAWMATDEGILERTLRQDFARDANGHLEQPHLLYRPYRIGPPGAAVACGFRDHVLSDLIGFTYASWSADAAAEDFVHRLVEGGRRAAGRMAGEPTIFIILDGENAWEHFDGQGRPFLRALYGALSSHPDLRTVTMSDACASAVDALASVHPGSWIHSDFYIWMGHADDHRAWSQLGDARRALESATGRVSADALAAAREEIFIAEGSDWFWWYGDDHSSENDADFDALFRRHLRNAYGALGMPVPEELFVTNISTQAPEEAVMPPLGLIDPVLDGETTSYFEWLGAGVVESEAAGAMHRGDERAWEPLGVSFGCSRDALFVRVDAGRPMRHVLADGLALTLNLLRPAGHRVVITQVSDGSTKAELTRRSDGQRWEPVPISGLAASVGESAEVRVPFGALGLVAGDLVALTVSLNRGHLPVDQLPKHRPIEVTVPGAGPSTETVA